MTWNETLVGKTILEKKYFHEGEDFDKFLDRVSGIYSEEIRDDVRDALKNGDLIPAGRTLYGAGDKGKRNVTLSNCFICTTPGDTLDSIYDVNKEAAIIGAYGGGIGVDISNLRPRGAAVNNSAKESTGACSFMNLFNTTGGLIGQNNRHMAEMIALSCEHPDIEEFLEVKRSGNKLASANISIKFTDKFMTAVKNHGKFTLHFDMEDGTRIEKEVDAYDFFRKFCETQYDWGDPGSIFIDTVRRNNLLSGYDDYRIDVSNPCVSGDTLIFTDKGYKRIDSLVGEEVTIWNGFEWSKVTPRVTGHNQKMLKVTLSNGMSLDCTRYHKWILNDGKRVEAQNLLVGDKLAKWDYPCVGEAISLIGRQNKEAYTAGFYCGDGTTGLPHIELYGKKKEVLEFLEYDHVLSHEERSDRVILNRIPCEKDYVPLDRDNLCKMSWLAGLIDSDGALNDPSGSVTIASIDRDFLARTQLMLSTLGVYSYINNMHDEGIKMLPKNDGSGEHGEYYCHKSYRLCISGWYMKLLLDEGLILHRVQIEDIHPQRNASRFVTVAKVEEIPDAETVYCFNEPLNHSGIFNGIMTAQCAEYFGNAGNSCLLESINLYHCVKNPFTADACVDGDKLERLTRLGVRQLNETMDYGYDMLPLEMNRKCVDDWRSIGLGVFGLADMFVALGIRYGSDEAVDTVEAIMDVIFNAAVDESASLAKKYGNFGRFNLENTMKSPMLDKLRGDVKKKVLDGHLYNGTLLSIAPTGSIATMMGESGGVEPMFAISYERTTHSSEDAGQHFRVFSKGVEDLLRFHNIPLDTPDEEVKKRFPWVVTSYDIKPLDRVRMQEAMQKYVDNAISSTVNLPHEATVEQIEEIYMKAWESGLKGITVFRDGCKRANILGVKEKKVEKDTIRKPLDSDMLDTKRMPKRSNIGSVNGVTVAKHTACVKNMYVTVNNLKGKPMEVLVSHVGGCQSNIATLSRCASAMLKMGMTVEDVAKELREVPCQGCLQKRHDGEKNLSTSCGGAMGDALLEAYHPGDKPKKILDAYMICPECGERKLRALGKCVQCDACGYSKCD